MDQAAFSWFGALPLLRALLEHSVNEGLSELLAALRNHPPDGVEFELIGRLLAQVPAHRATALPVFRIAVLANYTSSPIANAARVALLREGYLADVYEAPFGAYRQEILALESRLYAFGPDAVIIATSAEEGDLADGPVPTEVIGPWLDRHVQSWEDLWNVLGQRLGRPVFQHLYESPEEEFLGVAERRTGGTATRLIASLNARLLETAPGFVFWIDVDRLATRVGRQHWRDLRLHHLGKFGFSPRFLPEYSYLLAAAVRSVTARTRKALILDLDNTLWGGVVGDDGLEGIRLGPGTAEGSAFESFCRYVKALGQRGVILGICSKNERAAAVEVFEKHAHMPLKLDDFAIIVCNWQDKATNLAEIARDLNVDVSSLVFVDDNPAECAWIRQSLPEVETIVMEGDPALFVRRLDYQHLFDGQAFSKEDLARAGSYQARAQFASLKAAAPDLAAFLASLDMKAEVRIAEAGDLSRLAQMEMKTNQFNLTTRRLSLEQLQEMAAAPGTLVLAVSLADRFANHGLVSYAAATVVGDTLRITDWLMSCRVFSRTLEHFVFKHIVRHALERNLRTIDATFTPTNKNKVMEGLFESLGFSCVGTPPVGPWKYSVSAADVPLKSYVVETSLVQAGK